MALSARSYNFQRGGNIESILGGLGRVACHFHSGGPACPLAAGRAPYSQQNSLAGRAVSRTQSYLPEPKQEGNARGSIAMDTFRISHLRLRISAFNNFAECFPYAPHSLIRSDYFFLLNFFKKSKTNENNSDYLKISPFSS